MKPALLSIADTKATLSVGKTTIYELIRAGDLETVKIGSRTLITADSISALISRGASTPNHLAEMD
jgi:excisionase family DNA binding protein